MASVRLQELSWSRGRERVSAAPREVEALLDVPCIPAPREGSDVVEKLQQRHRERHEQLLTDLEQKLASIDEGLQAAVIVAAEQLLLRQSDSLQVMDAALAGISEGMDGLTLRDVEGAWQGVESQLEHRLTLIEELHKQLMSIEEQRTDRVCECLQSYSAMLGGVAYRSPGELAGLMEGKAHTVNMASLANRQSAARLCLQLTAAERDVTGALCAEWEEKVGRWRDAVLRNTLSGFRCRIGVTEGGEGEGGGVEREKRKKERVKRELIAELSALQNRKQELLTQLSSLAPSTIVLERLHHLKETSCDIDQQMKSCLQRQLLGLSQVVEEMNSECVREMEACKDTLLSSGVCDSTTVFQVLNEDYLPLTQKLIEESRAELHSTEQSVEARLAEQQSWFQSVLQYGIGAAQLWRDYSSALVEVKRSQGEALERVRVEHDAGNQNREANLDLVLDHMRQAPNEEVLDQYLREAITLLKTICAGYEEFHSVVLGEVGVWSAGVEGCVCEYDTALCRYLGVARAPPNAGGKKDRNKRGSRAKAGSKLSKKTTPTPKPRPPSVATIVEEVLMSSGEAIRYYVSPEASTEDRGSVFLTQNEESEGAPNVIASQALSLSKSTYEQSRSSLRATYLAHLEGWREEVRAEGERERREREEEAHTELDLRLHLHQPRQDRITQDIHGVRAAELLAHRDRVGRHARAVVAAITDIKTTPQTASDAMGHQKETYSRELEELEGSLSEAVSTVRLRQVEQKARHLLEKRLEAVGSIASDLKSTAENITSDLTSATTAFRQSLKLFSEAGNYCPEEVELFSHKLDRLTAKLSSAQQQMMTTLTEVTAEHTQSARDTFSRFQNTYQLYWTDACYMEDVKRSLTNLQLSIRSVVADSNSQASNLHDVITRLQSGLMEYGDPAPILEELPALVDLCTQHTAYLYCRATLQQGGRVGGKRERGPTQPISAVNISRSIRDHTRAGSNHQSTASAQPATQPQVKDGGKKTGTVSRRKTIVSVERKNINFGVGGGEDATSCFLPQIRALLSSHYDNLHTMTEAYYCSKGVRPVTGVTMASSCEEALDRLIETCQTYRRQSEEYRNRAISEFRGQLDSVLSLLVGVVPRVIDRVKVHHMTRWEKEREELQETHCQAMEDTRRRKVSHEKGLHPGLGHPAASHQLQQLRQAEQLRHENCLQHIQQHRASVQSAVQGIGRELTAELAAETERMLTLCDTVPTTNEIIPGCVKKTELPMDLLLRQKQRPSNPAKAEEEEERTEPCQTGCWPGLAAALLDRLCLESEERDRLSRAIESSKSSAAHTALVTARDTALQEFVLAVEDEMAKSERCEREERQKEEHWWDHWNHSLQSLGQLYST